MPFLIDGLKKIRVLNFIQFRVSLFYSFSLISKFQFYSVAFSFILYVFALLHDLRRRPFPIDVTVEIGSVSRCHDPTVFQERHTNQARLMYYFNCNLTINIYHTVSCF